VSTEEGRAFASNHRAQFFETSAETGEGVRSAFEDVVRWILGSSAFQAATSSWSTGDETVDLMSKSSKTIEENKGGCCS
jgi:hypothetical protein